MATLASVIVYGLYSSLPSAGIPGRLYLCSDPSGIHEGQFLRDNGSSWDTAGYLATFGGSGGFANPMTTLGDIIAGGASGVAERLGVGSNGKVLTANSSATYGVDWESPGSGSPTGSAGGDLSGTYPNPAVAQVNGGSFPVSAGVLGTNGAKQPVAATAAALAGINYAAGGGTANAQTATYAPPITALIAGLQCFWLPSNANSSGAPTFAPNGLTAKTIVKVGGVALVANDLATTAIAFAIYDGTNWELQNPQTAPGASGTQTIASGTAVLGTSAIASGAQATTVTVSASGVATTDNIIVDFNADPTSTTGYVPSTNGMLAIIKFPTANNVNFIVVNNTSASITPGAVTLNWRVVR